MKQVIANVILKVGEEYPHFYREEDGIYVRQLTPVCYGTSEKFDNLPKDARVVTVIIKPEEVPPANDYERSMIEDFCTWKTDLNNPGYWVVNCCENPDYLVKESVRYFEYCPYCGRKIERV